MTTAMTTQVSISPPMPESHQATLPLTAAEFFAGIGLMRMGLERCGWKVTYANDIAQTKKNMYAAHFRDAKDHFQVKDIHKLTPADIPDVTLATASFPCTDLSLAGARAGLAGEQSGALWGFTSMLEAMGTHRPPIVLLENVTAFLSSHGGEDFRQTLLMLNSLGYAVDAFVLDASWFVPQSRQRLFIVGVQKPDGDHDMLLPLANRIRPAALINFMLAHPEIRWGLRDLPIPANTALPLEDVLEVLEDNAPEWWSHQRAEYLFSQMSDLHRTQAEKMIAAKRWSYGTVFRRMRNGRSTAEMRTDSVAGCLRTPKGGSAKQILFRAGFGTYSARHITPRECARLMGADDYDIAVPHDQALFGFGDAVCVSAVAWIAEHYLNPLVQVLAVQEIEPGPARRLRFP